MPTTSSPSGNGSPPPPRLRGERRGAEPERGGAGSEGRPVRERLLAPALVLLLAGTACAQQTPDDCLGPYDGEGDCVADAYDNCLSVRNGPFDGAGASQCDTDGDGYGNRCDGDFDGDGLVSGSDLAILKGAVGTVTGDPRFDPDADLDCDGAVLGSDVRLFAPTFGGAPGPSGLACAGTAPCRAPDRENFLILVADDLGVDKIGVYGEHPTPPATPNIDSLAEQGVLFRNAWSNPSCSPGRAAALTGQYALRTGIGRNTGAPGMLGLDPAIPNLANVLETAGYRTAAFGKWHLAGCAVDASGGCAEGDGEFDPTHPILSGFDYHAGTRGNLGVRNEYHYCRWQKTVSERIGDEIATTTAISTTYATADTANEAIAWIRDASEPWLAWVAFNASHVPLHEVPEQDENCSLRDTGATKLEKHDAMTEKLDAEIGRILAEIAAHSDVLDRTTVVFFGDNGTSKKFTTPPFDENHAKMTLYEGGINVPFIVAGPHAGLSRGAESRALVNTTDLFATIMEIAGLGAATGDSTSLLPHLEDPGRPSLRSYAYAERFWPSGPGPFDFHDQAIRGQRYKLIRRVGRIDLGLEFFDLVADPFEQDDLLAGALTPEQRAGLDALIEQLSELLGDGCIQSGDSDTDCVLDGADNCTRIRNGPGEGSAQDQCDTDGDGYGNHCDGDFDADGMVLGSDLVALKDATGTARGDPGFDPDADMNCDGAIDAADHDFFALGFGGPPGPSGVAPENAAP